MGVDYCWEKEGVERKEHEYRGGILSHFPVGYKIFRAWTSCRPQVPEDMARSSAGLAAGRARGIMGSNDEKPEGLYQWELAAVCPSNGTQTPPTTLDNAPEEPDGQSVDRFSLARALSLSRQSDFIFSVLVVVTFDVYKCFSLARWSVSLSRICSCLKNADTPAAARRLLLLAPPFLSHLPNFVSFSLLGQLTSRPPPTLLWSTQY